VRWTFEDPLASIRPPRNQRSELPVRRGSLSLSRALPLLIGFALLDNYALTAQLPRGAGPSPAATSRQHPPDSTALVESLRRAQRRFERLRRHALPRRYAYSRGPCDETFGQFCYWDDDDDPRWEPEPEDEHVRATRESLITQLDRGARTLATDAWIAGQRVRYLVEFGRLEDAARATASCRAAPWWCTVLAAYVAHRATQFARSDSLFASGLGLMTETERCGWNDLGDLLDGALARRYRGLSCSERDSLNARIFWLSDPLYLVPGNERRTEHYARHVYHRLLEGTETPYDTRWGDDNLDLTRRYGWSEGWERSLSTSTAGRSTIVGRRRRSGEHFVPPSDVVESPSSIIEGSWPLDPERPRERYAPAYAHAFDELAGQIALFRRPGSAVVVAAFEVPRRMGTGRSDSIGTPTDADIALIASRDDQSGLLGVRRTVGGPTARLSLRMPSEEVLLSVETLNRTDSVAGRRRIWLDARPPAGDSLMVSDLLLVEAGTGLPATLDQAVALARPSARFVSGDSIGVFWEVHDLRSLTDARIVSLVVIKEGRGLLRRAVEWLGLAERDKPTIRLEWTDIPTGQRQPPGKAVTLRLPDDQRGRFTLRLEIAAADGRRTKVERQIWVAEQSPAGRAPDE